jgi:2C-methyl-D-erythritol 2,4-cyclodiphosphate synthase
MWNQLRIGHGYDAHRFADALLPDAACWRTLMAMP